MNGVRTRDIVLGVAGIALIGGIGYGGYSFYQLSKEYDQTREALEAASGALEVERQTNAQLSESLSAEQARNADFENQIGSISSTVGKLDKLQNTDPQVLAKYSKVYFLSDTYIPRDLVTLASSSGFEASRTYKLTQDAAVQLEDMFQAAENDDITLKVASAYRSFNEQGGLKSTYRVTYGKGANAFSADQGYSEHQLGTTVDITTPAIGGGFVGFDGSEAFTWLNKNAWKYGFVLSYPKGNTYYVFEPWHWRFVGTTLAEELHSQNIHFYEMDQRKLNQYLIDYPN